MCKMKSVLCIVAMFSFALVACTERLPEAQMPDVENGAITMVKATVKPLEVEGIEGVGNYSWSEASVLGIYGSEMGVNENYSIVKSTAGESEAYFYGNMVDGDLTIYMPHSLEGGANALEGRVQVRTEQKYYATALDHLMNNASFLGTATSNEVEFDYYSGLVKVVINHDVENISQVKVKVVNINEGAYKDFLAGYLPIADFESGIYEASGVAEVVIRNFPEGFSATYKANSDDSSATVWVALSPGTYENLVVEVENTAGDKVVLPVQGPFEVKRCAVCEKECVAVRVDHDNGADDFVGVPGDFNENNESVNVEQ